MVYFKSSSLCPAPAALIQRISGDDVIVGFIVVNDFHQLQRCLYCSPLSRSPAALDEDRGDHQDLQSVGEITTMQQTGSLAGFSIEEAADR